MKLMLDENLSPKVAQTLRTDGVDAIHIRERGLLEASDQRVLDRAFAEERIVVTANVDDFVKLARTRELHAGIILIDSGGLLRHEQLVVIRQACALIGAQRDMANLVLRVAIDGVMTFCEIPTASR